MVLRLSTAPMDNWFYVRPVLTTSNLHLSKIFTKLFRKQGNLYLKVQLNVKWASHPHGWGSGLGLQTGVKDNSELQIITNIKVNSKSKEYTLYYYRIKYRSIFSLFWHLSSTFDCYLQSSGDPIRFSITAHLPTLCICLILGTSKTSVDDDWQTDWSCLRPCWFWRNDGTCAEICI